MCDILNFVVNEKEYTRNEHNWPHKNEKDGICAADFCFRARTGLFNDEFNNECILE